MTLAAVDRRSAAPDDTVRTIIDTVRADGVCVVPGVLSKAACAAHVATLERAVQDQIRKGEYFGSRTTQVLYNYFVHDDSLFELMAHPLIDAVMTTLIDKDYVLISPSARNPRIRPELPEGVKVSGEGWHIDSRVANPATGELFKPSLGYYAVVALEDFTRENAATKYIPRSHLMFKKPPDREADLEHSVLIAEAGSMVFFDPAFWHRTGVPTTTSRWSVFNMYGPWFMKPYFRFAENYSKEKLKALPPLVQQLLHLRSVPPVNANVRSSTVTAEPVFD
jgi:ectoine hydroxylase-related dioxygenase (phytanoyl-CoA dioxygenase family)